MNSNQKITPEFIAISKRANDRMRAGYWEYKRRQEAQRKGEENSRTMQAWATFKETRQRRNRS